jgi:hypothetical protein
MTWFLLEFSAGLPYFFGKNIPKRENILEDHKNMPNDHNIYHTDIGKIFQMIMKYTNIFHSKALQNLPNLGFRGVKIYHLAALALRRAGYANILSVVWHRGSTLDKCPQEGCLREGQISNYCRVPRRRRRGRTGRRNASSETELKESSYVHLGQNFRRRSELFDVGETFRQ